MNESELERLGWAKRATPAGTTYYHLSLAGPAGGPTLWVRLHPPTPGGAGADACWAMELAQFVGARSTPDAVSFGLKATVGTVELTMLAHRLGGMIEAIA